ncbi:MAG: (Fe-S)-binding protein [Deltaproteobacteria bacterium]|nr:(Fe-S)-binding protein [Deltaproteobacteria bacterium]
MENEIKNQEATAVPAQPEMTAQTETPAKVEAPSQEPGMKKINIEKFSPRMLMELDACTRCGECSNWCPAYDQDNREPLTPRGRATLFKGIIARQHGAFRAGSFLGNLAGTRPVTDEEMKAFAKDLYACSTCMQCHYVCPVAIDTVELWERIRETVVDCGYGPLDSQKDLVLKTKNYDNPWGQPRSSRARWGKLAKKKKRIKEEPRDISKSKSEVLYYVGCTASYDNNVEEVAINTTNILHGAGVDFGILGNKEKCCGSVLLRMGERESFLRLCNENIEQFHDLGIKTLITSCAGCFKTIKMDYAKIRGMNFEIKHTCEYIVDLIKLKKLTLTTPVNLTVTYHDPCHLGRHSGVFDAPRELLSMIPGVKLIEMERIRENSRCCGAGGGLKSGYPDMQNMISQKRVTDAINTGATELVSACPFCYQGLQVGIQAMNAPVKMRDITELVCMAMGIESGAGGKDEGGEADGE